MTDRDDILRISNAEMQCTLSIAKAVNDARRRGPDSRKRIALTLLTLACGLVDQDIDGSRALMQAMGKLVEEMEDVG
jgi:hypothetical protein